jgi:hypothetical protein
MSIHLLQQTAAAIVDSPSSRLAARPPLLSVTVMPLVFPAVVMRHAENEASRPPRAARNGTGSERLLAAENSPETV